MSEKIKQLKLSNDEEIICEVVQWEDDEVPMVVRGPMKIIAIEDYSRGVRFYAFRPWMGFADDPEILHTLNPFHIIGSLTPESEVISHYESTVQKIKKAITTKNMPLDEITENLDSMDEEDFDMLIDKYLQQKEEIEMVDSSDQLGKNIIKFKPKDTVH